MDLHAGFAAALSFTQESLQAFVHAAYVNDIIPAALKPSWSMTSQATLQEFEVKADLGMDEPVLELVSGEFMTLHFDLFGLFLTTGEGNPDVVSILRMRLSAQA